MRRFELHEGTANKFWEIDVEGASHTTRYGKVGTTGKSTTKEFDSAKAAGASAEKLIASKIKKGYKATDDGAVAMLEKLASDFDLEIPSRVRQFANQEAAARTNLIPPVPTYADFRIEFVTDPDLDDLLEMIDSGERYDSTEWIAAYPGWLPFATLAWEDTDAELSANATEGKEFFCIDTQSQKCAVYLYHAAGAPEQVAKSLDDFLGLLTSKRAKPLGYKEQEERAAALEKLFNAKEYDACVQEGTALLRIVDSRFGDSSEVIQHCLGWAHAKIGQFGEAKKCFGSGSRSQLQVALIEVYEEKNYLGALTRLSELDGGSGVDTRDAEFVIPKLMARCHFQLDAPDKAQACYRRIHDTYRNRGDKSDLTEVLDELTRLEFTDVLEWFGKESQVVGSPQRVSALKQQWALFLDEDRELARAFSKLLSFELEDASDDDLLRLFASEVINFELKGHVARIPSLALFEELRQLKWISSSIATLGGLEHAPHLTHLNLAHSHVKDLAPLEKCSNLRLLDLRDNAVIKLRPLKKLHNLEELYLFKNRIDDMDALGKLPKLRKLELGRNIIKSVEIYGLDELVELDLSDNCIRDFQNHGMSKLEVLDLSRNYIDDLSCFGNLPCLKELDISDNCFTDISPLQGLEGLQVLNCESSEKIKGVEALAGLKSLKTLSSDGTFVPKELAAFRKLRPDVDVD